MRLGPIVLVLLGFSAAGCAAGQTIAPGSLPAAQRAASRSSDALVSRTQVPPPAAAPAVSATTLRTPNAAASALPARSADDFVAAMGVDVDLLGPADSQQPAIARSFAGLGVRHTRIGVLEDDPPYEANVNAFFAENPNVKAYGITNCAPPLGAYPAAAIGPSDVSGFQSRTGNHLDRIESVNEPNNAGDATWPADTQSCVAPFVGATGGVPLVAPALVALLGGNDERILGAVDGTAFGNIHRYFSGRNPDPIGWGDDDPCGTYGALSWSICWASVTAPGKPLVVTETGWNSETEVDELTQAKYVERVFFTNAQAGIAATSLYTFVGYKGGDGFGGDGLLRPDLTQKPAYAAVANMTKLLSDPGDAFVPAALPLAISPAPVAAGPGLRAMLLGKRDGSYDLALWQEVQSADPDQRGSDTVPAPVTVSLRPGGYFTATLHAWQDDGSAPAAPLAGGSTLTVPVTDRLSIVELRRASGIAHGHVPSGEMR